MHEFMLFGQISGLDHRHILQQLAGVTRMQPQPVTEIHLVFKGRTPTGLNNLNSTGASQDIVAPEAQKTRALLGSSLFYIQLVGEQVVEGPAKGTMQDGSSVVKKANGDVAMRNGHSYEMGGRPVYRWRLEFRDIPDPGKQPVSIRLMSRTPIEEGDPVQFLSDFGYEYAIHHL